MVELLVSVLSRRLRINASRDGFILESNSLLESRVRKWIVIEFDLGGRQHIQRDLHNYALLSNNHVRNVRLLHLLFYSLQAE